MFVNGDDIAPDANTGSVSGNSSGAEAGEAPRACHVVRFTVARAGRIESVECATLSEDQLAVLLPGMHTWRSAYFEAADIQEACDHAGLPPLAIWRHAARIDARVPAPLSVPIEPLELDEGRAPLAEIVQTVFAEPEPNARRRSYLRRMMVRLGLPSVVLLHVFNVIALTYNHRGGWIVPYWVAIITTLLGSALLIWWLSEQWFIVPGAVIVRRSLAGEVGQSLRRYTPADTLLIIRPSPPDYQAELWQGEKLRRRRITDLERAALLAAWQSQLEPPELERLSDLR